MPGRHLSAGDLIFWSVQRLSKTNSVGAATFESAIVDSAGGDRPNVFHVSLVVFVPDANVDSSPDRPTIGGDTARDIVSVKKVLVVHPVPSAGVVKETLLEAAERLAQDEDATRTNTRRQVTVHPRAVLLPPAVKARAVTCALQKAAVQCHYNDVFSADCRDSADREAYYCCQFVRVCYDLAVAQSDIGSSAGGQSVRDDVFPVRTLNFRSGDGQVLPYWRAYFEQRRRPVPENEIGSHPSDLLDCSVTEQLEVRFSHQDKLGLVAKL